MDLKSFQGKKTYLVAIATIMYALGGAVAGFIDLSIAVGLILGALGLGGLRAGVTKPVQAFPLPQAPTPIQP